MIYYFWVSHVFNSMPGVVVPLVLKVLLLGNFWGIIVLFIINTLLEGLNWRLNSKPEDGLPNVLPEAAVRSEASGTRRFLDYLGFERETLKPLLVVEAKRLKAPLPVLATLPKPGTRGVPVLPDETLMGYSIAISVSG